MEDFPEILKAFTNMTLAASYGDDFTHPNHDSRVRENSEVVIILPYNLPRYVYICL
jgi:hypothetical protein